LFPFFFFVLFVSFVDKKLKLSHHFSM